MTRPLDAAICLVLIAATPAGTWLALNRWQARDIRRTRRAIGADIREVRRG